MIPHTRRAFRPCPASPHRSRILCALVAATGLLLASTAEALPPVVPGFANVPQTAGSLLAGIVAPMQGRTSIFAYHNGLLYSIPESPGSLGGSDQQVRTWSLLDPSNPMQLGTLGVTRNPINAHGFFFRGADLIIGDGHWTFRASATPGVNLRMDFPGMDANPALQCAGDRGCLFYPWYVGPTLWSYNAIDGQQQLYPRIGQPPAASWNLVEQTGVIGHPFILGNRLYFASDQSRTGVASYDISDPANPVLLGVLNTGGPGGYWPELFGLDGRLYLVFPYNTNGNGMRVVDITDPTDMQFVIDIALPGAEAMYATFQDEFAFIGDHKIDMRTYQSVLFLDSANRTRTLPHPAGGITGLDTSQFALPLGNLLITGGANANQGMAIWAHQDAPDTRAPEVAFHVPRDGQTHYPTGAPISLLIHETLEAKTLVLGSSLVLREIDGDAVPASLTLSFDDVITITPNAPLQPDTAYELIVVEGGIKDAAGNGILGHRFSFSTGAELQADAPPQIDSFGAIGSPALSGGSVGFAVVASDPEGLDLHFRFDPGDGSPRSEWSAETGFEHVYGSPGHHRASVQARDPGGRIAAASRVVTVLDAFPTPAPPTGSSLACLADGSAVALNPDHDSAARIAADGSAVLAEVVFDSPGLECRDPRRIARVGSSLWASCFDNDRLLVLDAQTLAPLQAITLAHGSRPFDVVAAADGTAVYVSTHGRGELLRFDAATLAQTGQIGLGAGARAVALSADGGSAFVTRFLSPGDSAAIWQVQLGSMSLSRTIQVPKFGGIPHRDSSASGRGTANYLADIALAPGGTRLWFVATKPNTERGPLIGPDLSPENTMRTVAVELDVVSGALTRVFDIDNADSASAVGLSPLGDYLFVALQGNRELAVFDLLAEVAVGTGALRARRPTGHAPQGLCLSGGTLWVQNLLGPGLSRFELGGLLDAGEAVLPVQQIDTVSTPAMSAQVLAGKRVFYDAADPRMSSDGYISCASCHLDGGHDGRSWDFTGRGEGLRNTIDLRGRAGMAHGKVHWSANFDEIQDFEHDIRGAFGGLGFLSEAQFAASDHPLGTPKAGMSPELDALATYVGSLDASHVPRSPWREPDGSFTALAQDGNVVFAAMDCGDCHTPPRYTRSPLAWLDLVDVGSLSSTSGGRLGENLAGIDVPSLLALYDTAPFLHDGSAATLESVFGYYGGAVLPAESGTPSAGAYVEGQFVALNHDDTVRGRAMVQFDQQGSRLAFANVDGGSGGLGAIELRYSAHQAGQIALRVNGVERLVNLPATGNPTWANTHWRRLRVEDLLLAPGAVNSIEVERTALFARLALDDILLARPENRAAAASHREVLELQPDDRAALLRFLLELEPAAAVVAQDRLFGNGFED
jgi:DNA-binding beta-propeller fold protein YncE